MKAKTMLGMIACASACVSLSAFGYTNDNWFAVSASGTTATLTNVATNMGVEVTGGKLVLDNDDSSPLLFTPDASFAGTNRSDGVVTVAASAFLTPNSTNDLATSLIDGAKVGLAVGVDDQDATNYYGYAAAGWKQLTGAGVSVPDSADTSFTLILDYRTHTAKFYIGETLMTYNGTTTPSFGTGTEETLQNIAAYGSGSITLIDTDFEIAVAAYGGVKYGSIADASEAAKATAPGTDPTTVVQVVNENGTTEQANAVASNGLPKIVCEALGLATDSETANIVVAPPATDTDTGNITLAVNTTGATEASAVKFRVWDGTTTTDYENASEIKIPLASGVYTITPVLK